MGKVILGFLGVVLVVIFVFKDEFSSGGVMGFDFTGPKSVMTGTNSFGAGMSGAFKNFGDAFR